MITEFLTIPGATATGMLFTPFITAESAFNRIFDLPRCSPRPHYDEA